jgi:hypothetical protein
VRDPQSPLKVEGLFLYCKPFNRLARSSVETMTGIRSTMGSQNSPPGSRAAELFDANRGEVEA